MNRPLFSIQSITYVIPVPSGRYDAFDGIGRRRRRRRRNTSGRTTIRTCLHLPTLARFRHQKIKKPLKNQGLGSGF
jgi:hypothetical protein